jgi:RNA polymerase sigma-70 factor (ECF subfamily)
MNQEAITFRRCANMIALLNGAEGWGLDPSVALVLAEVAATYIHPEIGEAQLRTVIVNIRRDRTAVEALRGHGSAAHHQEWISWMGQARAILRKSRLDWARDGAVDLDDLAQIALLELARALPGFRYQSRFSTWAYQVITRGVQRHLRDMSAKKRLGNIDAMAEAHTMTHTVGGDDLPEAQAEARLLTATVEAELTAALGQRNAEVFRLWACHDFSAEMIGKRMGLSVARVYAVIAQARQYLREHAAIQSWGEMPKGS